MSRPTLLVAEDPSGVAREAAGRFVSLASALIESRGRFSIGLSGGSTPRALYQLLASEPFRSAVRWQRVEVFWGDERAVPPSHPDSNFRMAQETLLDMVPIPADRIHRMPGDADDLDGGAVAYEAEIARVLGGTAGDVPPAFDLILLGLGTDGHTASLFPGTRALAERHRWVVTNHVPKLGADRLTLTWPILNRAANVLFLVSGPDKAPVLREVLEGPYDPERLPAQGVRPETGAPVWILDRAAASFSRKAAAATRARSRNPSNKRRFVHDLRVSGLRGDSRPDSYIDASDRNGDALL
jgi:6-phosphogluconolactonase